MVPSVKISPLSPHSATVEALTEFQEFISDKKLQDANVRLGTRCTRCLLLCLTVLLCIVGFVYGVLPHAKVEYVPDAAKYYDPAVGLTLRITACDVNFVAGTEPSISLVAIREAGVDSKLVFTWAGAAYASSITSITAENQAHTCERALYEEEASCGAVCLIRVTVPPSAKDSASFTILQDEQDASQPHITIEGINAKSIAIGSDAELTMNLHVILRRCILSGAITARMRYGYVSAWDSRLGSADMRSPFSASFYLFNLDVSGFNHVHLDYRQPMNRLCFSTDAPQGQAQLNVYDQDPHGNCLKADSYQKTARIYDPDSNGWVTRTEFNEGLSRFLCCGKV